MQTFLPYSEFTRSAKVLDRQRLGKQRVEAYQIIRVLVGESKGWANHPAVKLWEGHEWSLCMYGVAMCQEWIRRGYKDSLKPRFLNYMLSHPEWDSKVPELIGIPEFHRSHQSNLIRKMPEHYLPIFGNVPDDLPYIWEKENAAI